MRTPERPGQGPLEDDARQQLRVVVVAPPWFHVPPDAYGGIEAMVADLVDGLVRRGHEVCLVGAGDPATLAQRHVAVYPQPIPDRLGDTLPEVVTAAAAARAIAEFEPDVVHDNTVAGPLTATCRPAPTVMTAHGPAVGEEGRYLAELGSAVHLVAISDAQRRAAPSLHWVATVHNGIDVGTYPVGDGAGDYLLFLGRFSPDKGAHLAIEAARATGRPLVLAGKLNEPEEQAYFDEEVRPHLGADLTYVGEADAAGKRELYAGAAALLFPICWDEPFGLVMVEAMACGTPVVALRRGSVPEVVVDGMTGFVVERPDELTSAIGRIDEIERSACRRHVEEQFDIPVMVEGYERVFCELTSGRAPGPAGVGAEDRSSRVT